MQNDDLDDDEKTPALSRATDWLNEKLAPVLGTAEIGPDDPDDTTPAEDRPCPICGQPMGEHPREVEDGHVFYHHPDETPTNLMESE